MKSGALTTRNPGNKNARGWGAAMAVKSVPVRYCYRASVNEGYFATLRATLEVGERLFESVAKLIHSKKSDIWAFDVWCI